MDDPSLPQAAPTSDAQTTPVHLRHPRFSVAADPQNSLFVYDTQLIQKFLQPPQCVPHHIAVLSQVSISRKGGFSCPVRTGAVLACVHVKPPSTTQAPASQASEAGSAIAMPPICSQRQLSKAPGCMHVPASDDPSQASLIDTSAESRKHCLGTPQVINTKDAQSHASGSIRHALADLTPPVMIQLKQCRGFEALHEMVGQKLVPPMLQVQVHRTGTTFCGVTVEFEAPRQGCVQACLCYMQVHVM